MRKRKLWESLCDVKLFTLEGGVNSTGGCCLSCLQESTLVAFVTGLTSSTIPKVYAYLRSPPTHDRAIHACTMLMRYKSKVARQDGELNKMLCHSCRANWMKVENPLIITMLSAFLSSFLVVAFSRKYAS